MAEWSPQGGGTAPKPPSSHPSSSDGGAAGEGGCAGCRNALADAWETATGLCRGCHAGPRRAAKRRQYLVAALVALCVISLSVLRLRGVLATLRHPQWVFWPALAGFAVLCHRLSALERRITDHTPPEELRP